MSRAQRALLAVAGAILEAAGKLGSWCLELLSIPVTALFQYAVFRPAAVGVTTDEDVIPNPWGNPDD